MSGSPTMRRTSLHRRRHRAADDPRRARTRRHRRGPTRGTSGPCSRRSSRPVGPASSRPGSKSIASSSTWRTTPAQGEPGAGPRPAAGPPAAGAAMRCAVRVLQHRHVDRHDLGSVVRISGPRPGQLVPRRATAPHRQTIGVGPDGGIGEIDDAQRLVRVGVQQLHLGADAELRRLEVEAGRAGVACADAGEVVVPCERRGERARLDHRLRERDVAAHALGQAFGDVEAGHRGQVDAARPPDHRPSTDTSRRSPQWSAWAAPRTVGDRSASARHPRAAWMSRRVRAVHLLLRSVEGRAAPSPIAAALVRRLRARLRSHVSAATNSSCVWSIALPASIRTDSAETEASGIRDQRAIADLVDAAVHVRRGRRVGHCPCASRPDRRRRRVNDRLHPRLDRRHLVELRSCARRAMSADRPCATAPARARPAATDPAWAAVEAEAAGWDRSADRPLADPGGSDRSRRVRRRRKRGRGVRHRRGRWWRGRRRRRIGWRGRRRRGCRRHRVRWHGHLLHGSGVREGNRLRHAGASQHDPAQAADPRHRDQPGDRDPRPTGRSLGGGGGHHPDRLAGRGPFTDRSPTAWNSVVAVFQRSTSPTSSVRPSITASGSAS